mmetsp:Transcript_2030/g.2631  ORF Transcript_2030/g.2631 Transcript_2030/m.2631 type:complete len:119 (-) Transcript_2030:10-366(-)
MPDNIAFKCIKSNPIFGSIKTQRRIMSNTPDVDPDKLGVDHNHEQNKIVLPLVLAVVDPSVVRIDLRLVPQLAEQHGSLMHALDGVPVACADVPVECDDAPEACDVQLGAYDDALLGA